MHTNGDTSATGQATRRGSRQRHSIPEAAKALGLTEEAVRQRVKRGTLESIKDSGNLFVLLNIDTSSERSNDTSGTRPRPVDDRSDDVSSDTSRLVEALQDEVAHLRRQVDQSNERDRENRRIIAALTTRIPELPTSSTVGPRDLPERVVEESTKVDASEEPQAAAQRRSWLYRFFLGPS